MQQKNTTPVSYVGKHTFTQEEKDAKLQQMLAAMRQKDEIEDEFKTTKSNYKSKIDAKTAEIKLVGNLLNAGFEDRTFTCTLVKNFDDGRREYFEIGTGKLIGTEPLTASDYQTQLQIDEDAIKANNEAADKLAEEQVQLTPEEIEKAEEGPEYTVETDRTPLEIEETPAEEPRVIDEPTEQKGGNKKTAFEIKSVPEEDIDSDPFGMDDADEEDVDPFDFGSI